MPRGLSRSVILPSVALSGARTLQPPVVELRRDRVEVTYALLEPLLGLLGCLDRRAGVAVHFLVRVGVPRADQLRRHLHVTLKPEVLAEGERLVGAVRAAQNSRRAAGDREGLAVPVEAEKLPYAAEPAL